jgi:hypothetical protein
VRAGDVKTGPLGQEVPTEAEHARREKMRRRSCIRLTAILFAGARRYKKGRRFLSGHRMHDYRCKCDPNGPQFSGTGDKISGYDA